MNNDRPTFPEVLLLAAIAFITGAMVAAVVLSATLSARIMGYTVNVEYTTAGSGTGAALAMWYLMLTRYVFPRLKQPERKPALPAVTRIEQVSPDRKQLQYEDCPATLDQLRTIATRTYYGSAISNAAMEDVFADRAAYTAWRDWMIARGYCQWRGSTPQSGLITTHAGDEWLSRWYQPPSPTAQVYRQEDDTGRHTHARMEDIT